jgi:quercetin dioxygenase-like cupin family protein
MTETARAERPLVPDADGSTLALGRLELAPGEGAALADAERDVLAFVARGSAELELGGARHALARHGAALVLRCEAARLEAGADGVEAVVARVAPGPHRHAPMGEREVAVALEAVETGAATGSRSFRILFGPHDGCLDATLFVGAIPPGAAKLHYHLYDEIVYVVAGEGRLHLGGRETALAPGSAFRLRPQERHVVENLAADADLVVLGLFTPAGSPSAAYLDR